MLTAERSAPAGSYLCFEDGQLVQDETRARSPGTTIIVHDLFRNVPARLKFLKSPGAEGGRAAEVVSQYSLAYPDIKFTFISDGKTSLRTTGSGKLIDSLSAVYGLEGVPPYAGGKVR